MFNFAMKALMSVLEGLLGKLGQSVVKIVMSMASEKFMTWAIMDVATRIVESTNNTTDDVWLKKIKENLEEVNNLEDVGEGQK